MISTTLTLPASSSGLRGWIFFAVYQSGEFSGTKGGISKRGSPYFLRAIWIAASRATFCDPILSKYFQGLKERGKYHLTALSADARKRCNIRFFYS